jgi:hypothetical protein
MKEDRTHPEIAAGTEDQLSTVFQFNFIVSPEAPEEDYFHKHATKKAA